jgi:hypothetical protein
MYGKATFPFEPRHLRTLYQRKYVPNTIGTFRWESQSTHDIPRTNMSTSCEVQGNEIEYRWKVSDLYVLVHVRCASRIYYGVFMIYVLFTRGVHGVESPMFNGKMATIGPSRFSMLSNHQFSDFIPTKPNIYSVLL